MPRAGAKQVTLRLDLTQAQRDAISWDMRGRVAPLSAASIGRYFREILDRKIANVSADYAHRLELREHLGDIDHE